MVATDPIQRLHNKDSRIKQVLTRTEKLVDELSPEELVAFRAKLSEKLGDDEVAAHSAEDERLMEQLRQPEREERNYDDLLASLSHEIGELRDLYIKATTDTDRMARNRRIATLQHLMRLVEAAKAIPAESRSFGCEDAPSLKVSSRGTMFPEIHFQRHVFTTDDPLRIARLLDYMANDERPTITPIQPGVVALVNDENGEFGMWVNKLDAPKVIRQMKGALRRPFR